MLKILLLMLITNEVIHSFVILDFDGMSLVVKLLISLNKS